MVILRSAVGDEISRRSTILTMMFSRSCISLLDLASNDMLNFPQTPRSLPRVITAPGIISDAEDGLAGGGPISPLPEPRDKRIIVMNFLPLNAKRDSKSSRWDFTLDEDILQLQMKDGISTSSDVIYIGSLKVDIASTEQDEVAQLLLEKFKCVPTFLPTELHRRYYHGFCKQYLWPLFHYMLPMCSEYGNRFERSLWQAYVSANKIYADKVMEVINPEEDYVWVQDYHLMLMPTFLRRRFKKVKLGFFLHSPFPSSEIYRSLPVREEVLRALLNADLIGFHTFDYARHFLSCCSRMLGLNYVSKRGHIGLDYLGRTVYIKILPIGIHMGRIESALDHHSSHSKAMEIQRQFQGKKVILGIDDMDIFKGISLKLLAMEQLLHQNPDLQGKAVLIQIINPARSSGKDVDEAKRETYSATQRINAKFGSHNYTPIILIDRPLDIYEKTAYYVVSECCIVNAVRDGMNLVPYKYIACRQGTSKMNESLGIPSDSPRTSMLVVSEFIGCSPSLSGALRVNPWDIDAVSDALSLAIRMPALEKQLRHEKHYRYVKSHDVAYWARSFLQDLERSCKEHYNKRCWGIGFGLNFRILSLSPSFRKLSYEGIAASYKKAKRRAVFLDYDGTLVAQNSISKVPSPEVISVLNSLCNDSNNTVFLVSGRGRRSLGDWFKDCGNLGIAAEHGFFVRWKSESEWDSKPVENVDWKKIAEPVMDLYTETTDGSYVESKESALVWHYQDADPDFGSFQAMELLDHLESVLANEPVVVKKGQHIVEVNPQGVTKGLAAEKILSRLINEGKPPDFVLCIGDDKSDEDMFESMSTVSSCSSDVFACTVGQKPSKARYYLDDPRDVLMLLQTLSESECSGWKSHRSRVESFVSFEKAS